MRRAEIGDQVGIIAARAADAVDLLPSVQTRR
jgi:hypothetical protein